MDVLKLYLGRNRKNLFRIEGKDELETFFDKGARGWAVFYRDGERFVQASDLKECFERVMKDGDLYRAKTDPWSIRCSWRGRTRDGEDVVAAIDATVRPDFDSANFWSVWEPAILATRELGGTLDEDDVAARVACEADPYVRPILNETAFASLDDRASSGYWRDSVLKAPLARLGLKFCSCGLARFATPDEAAPDDRGARRRVPEETSALLERERRFREKLALLDERLAPLKAKLTLLLRERNKDEFKATLVEYAELRLERYRTTKAHELDSLARERDRTKDEDCERLAELDDAIERVQNEFERTRREAGETLVRLRYDGLDSNPFLLTAFVLTNATPDAILALGLQFLQSGDGGDIVAWFGDVKNKFGVVLQQGETTRNPAFEKQILVVTPGQSLQLEFTAPVGGYASVVCLGTSLEYFLLVPNGAPKGGVAPRDARVKKGKSYSVPGKKLFKGGLYEAGPTGWELYLVFITPKPLFDDEERFNRVNPCQFVKLSEERVRRLWAELALTNPDQYAVGIVGFEVAPA